MISFGFIIDHLLTHTIPSCLLPFFPINNPSVFSAEDPDLVHAESVIYL